MYWVEAFLYIALIMAGTLTFALGCLVFCSWVNKKRNE